MAKGFMRQISIAEFEKILVEYGNAVFDCGAFDTENCDIPGKSLDELVAIAEEKKKAVVRAAAF
jgi:hypothetical protein